MPSFRDLIVGHTQFGRIEAQRQYERMQALNKEYEESGEERKRYLSFFYSRHPV